MFLYLPVEQRLCSPYLGCYHTFGIESLLITAQQNVQVAFIPDVSTDEATVSLIACRCTHSQLDPIHLLGVIEDSI